MELLIELSATLSLPRRAELLQHITGSQVSGSTLQNVSSEVQNTVITALLDTLRSGVTLIRGGIGRPQGQSALSVQLIAGSLEVLRTWISAQNPLTVFAQRTVEEAERLVSEAVSESAWFISSTATLAVILRFWSATAIQTALSSLPDSPQQWEKQVKLLRDVLTPRLAIGMRNVSPPLLSMVLTDLLSVWQAAILVETKNKQALGSSIAIGQAIFSFWGREAHVDRLPSIHDMFLLGSVIEEHLSTMQKAAQSLPASSSPSEFFLSHNILFGLQQSILDFAVSLWSPQSLADTHPRKIASLFALSSLLRATGGPQSVFRQQAEPVFYVAVKLYHKHSPPGAQALRLLVALACVDCEYALDWGKEKNTASVFSLVWTALFYDILLPPPPPPSPQSGPAWIDAQVNSGIIDVASRLVRDLVHHIPLILSQEEVVDLIRSLHAIAKDLFLFVADVSFSTKEMKSGVPSMQKWGTIFYLSSSLLLSELWIAYKVFCSESQPWDVVPLFVKTVSLLVSCSAVAALPSPLPPQIQSFLQELFALSLEAPIKFKREILEEMWSCKEQAQLSVLSLSSPMKPRLSSLMHYAEQWLGMATLPRDFSQSDSTSAYQEALSLEIECTQLLTAVATSPALNGPTSSASESLPERAHNALCGYLVRKALPYVRQLALTSSSPSETNWNHPLIALIPAYIQSTVTAFPHCVPMQRLAKSMGVVLGGLGPDDISQSIGLVCVRIIKEKIRILWTQGEARKDSSKDSEDDPKLQGAALLFELLKVVSLRALPQACEEITSLFLSSADGSKALKTRAGSSSPLPAASLAYSARSQLFELLLFAISNQVDPARRNYLARWYLDISAQQARDVAAS